MAEHIVLVAFVVEAGDVRTAHTQLMYRLPRPSVVGPITSWWVAEDERWDGSDLDSAVFVEPGAQQAAITLLHANALTGDHNLRG